MPHQCAATYSVKTECPGLVASILMISSDRFSSAFSCSVTNPERDAKMLKSIKVTNKMAVVRMAFIEGCCNVWYMNMFDFRPYPRRG